jgi:Tol biopolymer transport system component
LDRTAKRITSGSEPDWSPDGKWIALADRGNIYVVHGDGTGRRLLIGAAALDAKPRWSPDGTKIAFVRARPRCAALSCSDLWIADRTGRNQRLLVRNVDTIDWQPSREPASALAELRHGKRNVGVETLKRLIHRG